jgi:RecA/RadA recombinase
MSNKWLKMMKLMESAVNFEYDCFAPENCLYSPSPYLNWITANKSHGFPKAASVLFFSEPKSGKSFLCLSMIAEMHKRDPEGIAVYVSTELRGQLQAREFPGIDPDRILVIDSNDPVEIFDELLDKNLKTQVQDGMPLRMMVIDSITGILGIKRKNADTIEQHLIGDQALTIGNALANLVPWAKRNRVMLIGTAQMRANIDASPYAEKTKMSASFSVRHAFEAFISVKRAGSADDKVDIEGKAFEEDDMKDARGNKLLNAHRVYVKMEANSVGPAGRAGVFTLSYNEGVVLQHEEIFWLGKNTGVIKTENNRTYFFGDKKFNGKKETALAIKDDPELASAILEEVRKLDAK